MAEAGRRQRAGWGTISREQIIDAAVLSVRGGHFEQMTIRSLAADLGVSPMALYRHVHNKDDLLDAVVDRLFVRRWRPFSAASDWRAWTNEAAERFRDFLISQPAALNVYLRHPVMSPTAVLRMKTMLEVLCSAGFDDGTAQRVYGAIHTYTIGFAALEASRARWVRDDVVLDKVTAHLATYTTSRQFTDGLNYLLEGIELEGIEPRRLGHH